TYADSSDTPLSSRSLELKVTDAAGFAAIAPTTYTGAPNPLNGADAGAWAKPSFGDLDGDGDLDAVVGDLYGHLHYFKNTGTATGPAFAEQTGANNPFSAILIGSLQATPTFVDLDGDGDLDVVAGDTNGQLHYFKNTGTAIAPAFTEIIGAGNPFASVVL